ncbi:MAG: hypothetical protein AAFU03_07715, partial [Bacteroidota bacterium]
MTKQTNFSLGFFGGRLLLTLGAILIWSSSFGQGFEITFGGPKEDQGIAILQMEDHGFLEVGFTEGQSGDDNDIDIFVVRTDVDGTTIWTRQIDEAFAEQPSEVIPSHDGHFLISGYLQAEPNDPDKSYLLKISETGELIWTKTYGDGSSSERLNHIVADPINGGYLLVGTITDSITERTDINLIKVDEDGEEIWRRQLGNVSDNEQGIAAIATNNGFIIGATIRTVIPSFDVDIQLYGISSGGDFQWHRNYGDQNESERLKDMIPTSDGNLVFVGSINENIALMFKANLNGDTLWHTEIDANPFDDDLRGVIEEDGGEAYVGVGLGVPDNSSFNTDVLMVKVNSEDGQLIYQRLIGDDDVLNTAEDLVPTIKGGYVIAAFNAQSGVLINDMTLFNTDVDGYHLTDHIRGRVFYSDDGCNPYQPGDLGLGGWLVRAEKEDAIFFSSTDSLGFYDLQVDTGTYEVTLLQQNDRWEICNPIAFSVQFDTPYDSARSDFVLIPELDCPLLDVELSASPAIACDVQSLNISYGNQGTALATDVQVTLELDDLLSYISSSVPVSAQDGQLLTFDLPDLPVGGRQSFTVNAAVACTGLENQQSISSQANILPVEDCAPVDPDWDMSSIEVTSTCDGDSIRFFITNISDNDMTGQLEYIVIEDQVMVIPPTPFDPLDASQGFEAVTLPANGSTYRMIAQQVPGHPGNQFPTAFVEGCGENENGNFTTGQVAQFADNDGDLNIDILTQEVLVLNTNVDLALRAYPKGYQDSIITPNTDLEYTIFFPLDSDEITIGRVVIRDTLSTLLDLNSLEMGAASHPYDFTL